MSKNVALFIDVANLYYAARGQDVDVDYVALLKHATKGRDLIRAYAYSGLDPENENQRKFLDFLSKNGYKVVHKDIRKFGDGRVKANLDIELVVDLFRLATRMDIAVIVSGDGDFASAIRALQDIGVRCEVISFRPNTSSDLIAVADEFTDIMKIIGIGRKKGEKGISMPEMPAKEVNPEFGFREASRGVAAAALAALREGEKPAGRSRRGRQAASAPAEEAAPASAEQAIVEAAAELAAEPVEPMTALEAHVDGTDGEQPRRRRRRRGGRGRGRGRRSEAQLEAAPAAAEGETTEGAEIGWEEFDDISQLGLTDLGEPGGEREYSFEEADPQTLAELGVEPGSMVEAAPVDTEMEEVAVEAAVDAAPASGRGRRTRGGRGRAAADAEAQASGDESTSASRSRTTKTAGAATKSRGQARAGSRGRKAAGATPEDEKSQPTTRSRGARRPRAGAPEGAAAEGKPAPRRRSSRSQASADVSSADASNSDALQASGGGSETEEAEEGIWQRFRSGRRTRGAS